jgi:hypothetical protein
MGFPYTTKMDSIGTFLTHVAKDGKPEKVDLNHLKSIGLKSSNDRPLIPLFKALGFIGSDGKPSKRWTDYRDKSKAKTVLADGIRDAYPELFTQYPDANNKSNDAIKDVVTAKTDLGASTADFVARTFKTLVGNAEFTEGHPAAPKDEKKGGDDGSDDGGGKDGGGGGQTTPQVAINIQLQLPPDADEDAYDKLFAAMAKHLKL